MTPTPATASQQVAAWGTRVSRQRRVPRWLLTALAGCIALVLSSCTAEDQTPATDLGDITPTGVTGTEAVVELLDFDFETPHVVAAGQRIVVVNAGETAHTFTAKDGAFDSGTVEPGKQTSFTVDRPGVYDYECVLHPEQMMGRLDVTG